MDSIQREKKRVRAKIRCAEDPECRARKLAASRRYYSRDSETIVARASENSTATRSSSPKVSLLIPDHSLVSV
jgi:hypothetical protein